MKKKMKLLSAVFAAFLLIAISGTTETNAQELAPPEKEESTCSVEASCWPGGFFSNWLEGPYGKISCTGGDCKRNQTHGEGTWVECDGVKASCGG